MYNYEKFWQDCHMIFSGSHCWHACVECKDFDNLYRKQHNIALIFETELQN